MRLGGAGGTRRTQSHNTIREKSLTPPPVEARLTASHVKNKNPRNKLTATNDFTIHVATVNGSGSQTANTTLLRAIFQMGVPVSGKNLFPSNIAGLPTWFTIRVNERGYLARETHNDVLVAMNPETSVTDIAAMGPGSV